MRTATLVMIEFKSGDIPEGPPKQVKITRAELIDVLKRAGFTFKEDKAELLPYQEFRNLWAFVCQIVHRYIAFHVQSASGTKVRTNWIVVL